MTSEGRFSKFSAEARKVLLHAQEEAHRFNHNYLGTEHLLLGLLRAEDGVASPVLARFGIDISKVRDSIDVIVGRGDRKVSGELGLTPRTKKVIELAADESRRLAHDYIGPEHILLGLVHEREGVAMIVMHSLGASRDEVREQVLRGAD